MGCGSSTSAVEPIAKTDRFYCTHCDKEFLNERTKTRHEAHCKSEAARALKEVYECQVCHKEFTNARIFHRHETFCLSQRPHCCDICQKRFASKDELQNHQTMTCSPHMNGTMDTLTASGTSGNMH